MTLTRDDIVEYIFNEMGFKKNRSVELVEAVIEIIKIALVSGNDVLVSGFGKFRVREKKARKGRNPATGDTMMLGRERL